MKFLYQKKKTGYIALMSVIIISLILLASTAVLSMDNYFSRFNILDTEYKRVSLGLAESCANVALLKIAQNPSYAVATTVLVGSQSCIIESIDNPVNYDGNNKKTVVINAQGQYQQTFSNIIVSSIVQDPDNAPPPKAALTVVVRTANSYGGTATSGDFTVNVTNNSNPPAFPGAGGDGTTILINPGSFDVNETMVPTNYSSSFLNSGYPYLCSGNASVNQSYVCVITNTELPTTFSLTAITNITRAYQIEPVPSNLQLSLSGPVSATFTSGVPISDLPAGSYNVMLSGVPSDYSTSSWGQDCSSGGNVNWSPGDKRYKTCAINIVEDPPTVPVRAALTIVAQVVNSYGGTATSSDFNINVSASNPSQGSFVGSSSGTTIYIDPGAFNITESDLANYQKSYLNSGYPYLCQGNASAGESYVCVITNNDVVTTAMLTVTANVNNNYGGTLTPSNITLKLDGNPTVSGNPISGLMPGSHTVSYSGVPAGYTPSSGWSQDCSSAGTVSLSPGDNKTCIIDINQNPPPSPSCADTLMMLDRTGSMGSTDLTDERNAAKALLDLYAPLSPAPKVGIGVFNDGTSSSSAPAKIVGTLTSVYSPSLYNAINTWLASSGGYTNLSSAVSVGHNELISNGSPTTPNVLLLLSDGITNRPGCSGSDSCATAENAATTAANTAKQTGTQIYTIHFGDTAGQDFLASLANGNDTGFFAPSNNSNVGWDYPERAYVSDNNRTVADNSNDVVKYSTFNFPTIPAGATITGIEVQVEGYTTNSRQAVIDLSWDGSNYTSGSGTGDKTTNMPGTAPANEVVRTFGGPADTWNRTWSPSDFTNFRVRLDANSSSGNLNIDQVSVKVYYTDNFYISPTSADMADIFTDIGKRVCPAAAVPPPPPPTTGNLIVITHVINDNSGTKQASNFSITVSGNSPSPSAFPGEEAPGVTVTLNPGAYSVNESSDTGYTQNLGSQCFGSIAAGQTVTCTIINDDTPPPSPPPPLPPPVTPPPPPPSATDSTIYVITHVINDNGKNKDASDFSIAVTGDDPVPSAFSGQEYPGVEVTLNPGIYDVTEATDSDYVETLGQGCSGTLIAGQAVTCTIINDDTPPIVPPPPLPPPPSANIIINSWIEVDNWSENP